MRSLLWRAVIAVICVALFWALLPPLFQALGFAASAALLRVLQIAIAGIAVLYVLTGTGPTPPVG